MMYFLRIKVVSLMSGLIHVLHSIYITCITITVARATSILFRGRIWESFKGWGSFRGRDHLGLYTVL